MPPEPAAAQAPDQAVQPPQQTPPPPATDTPPSPTPQGGLGTPTAQGAPAESEYTDLMELVRQQAPDLAGRFQNGHQAITHLLQEARRAQELQRLAPYAQTYMQHAPQFEAWRQQQARARQEAEAKRNEWFKAPEWDPRWRDAVERDQQGNLVAKQGYPPDVVNKYLAAAQHQRDFLDRLSFDPIGAIKPGLLQLIQEAVQPMLRQGLGGYQEQQAATSFVQQHRDWLFQGGQVGGQLTEWGEKFRQYVAEAHQSGIRPEAQGEYALRMVRSDFAMQKWQEMQAGQQPAPAAPQQTLNDVNKANFLAQRGGAAAPAPAQRAPAQATPPAAPTRGSHVNRLTQMMAKNAPNFGMKPDGLNVPF